MKYVRNLLMGMLILSSCQPSELTQSVVVENRYSIELPTFLSKTNDLNDDASLQYQNLYRDFYVIVLDETKLEQLASQILEMINKAI